MITVVICTYNRADLLPGLFASLRSQRAPDGRPVSFVFIDNNSCDDTAAVVQQESASFPHQVRLIREPRQGLAFARNRGIREARGEWLVFLDDDALPDPDWLHNLIRGIERLGCKAGGGSIIPLWPRRTPRWIARSGPYSRPRLFASYDLGTQCMLLAHGGRAPFGGNMIFHTTLAPELLKFDSRLGKVKESGAGGEEGDVFERVWEAGLEVGYVGNAVVRHPVDSARFAIASAVRFMYQSGKSDATCDLKRGDTDTRPRLRILLSDFRRIMGVLGLNTSSSLAQRIFWAACGTASTLGAFHTRAQFARPRRPIRRSNGLLPQTPEADASHARGNSKDERHIPAGISGEF
ncbi:MAG TPA: glycosyltransferase [Tepidisphaeraceae bacterium]|jgi:glycosyltransferase involved in cell wall biosynthesis